MTYDAAILHDFFCLLSSALLPDSVGGLQSKLREAKLKADIIIFSEQNLQKQALYKTYLEAMP